MRPADEEARAWALEASDLLPECRRGRRPARRRALPRLGDRYRRRPHASRGATSRRRARAPAPAGSGGAPGRAAILAGRRHEADGAVLGRAPRARRRARAALVARPDARRCRAPRDRRERRRRGAALRSRPGGCGARAPRWDARGPPRLRSRPSRGRAPHRWAAADVAFAPAQVLALEGIVRALSARDGLRPLLAQVLDTMVLWTGVERGLLLLRAPDGRLVPRAARNLARHDLEGEQLALSQTIARRAIDTGDAVVATDALSTLGAAHASVHALRLRSVLAVPAPRARRGARRRVPRRPRAQGRVRPGRARVGARRRVAGRDGHRRRARRGAAAPLRAPRRARARPRRGAAARARDRARGDADRARARRATAPRTATATTRSPAAASRCAISCASSIA